MWNNSKKTVSSYFDYLRTVLICIFAGLAIAMAFINSGDKVYDFSYNQMTARLNRLEYRQNEDDYIVTGDNAFFQIYIKDSEAEWKYLYADIKDESDIDCRLIYLDEDKNEIAEQIIQLNKKHNEIQLEHNKFEILKIKIEEEKGTVFGIQNMQLREAKNPWFSSRVYFIWSLASVFAGMVFAFLRKLSGNRVVVEVFVQFQKSTDSFADALGQCIPDRITYRMRRVLRVIVFAILILYITYAEIQGTSYMVTYASVHMWISAGLILIMATLCWQENKKISPTDLFKYLFVFLLFACLSDFETSKKIRYATFCMLVFGGTFCKCWNGMKHKEHLIEEFKYSVKYLFLISLVYCVLCRPAQPGICYSGYLPEAQMYGANLLFVLVIFLSDTLRKKAVVLNGIFAVSVFYLIWLTQQELIIIAAVIILVIYLVVSIFSGAKQVRKECVTGFLQKVVFAILGLGAVLLLRKLLYGVAPMLGTAVRYENDELKNIDLTFIVSIRNNTWKYFLMTKWLICKEYIRQFNFFGHANLTKFHGNAKWPDSRSVMNAFRYGALAGVPYCMMCFAYIVKAVKYSFVNREFFAAGFAAAGILAGIVAPAERPFSQVGWLLFYFGICWMLVAGEKKNEVS